MSRKTKEERKVAMDAIATRLTGEKEETTVAEMLTISTLLLIADILNRKWG